MLAVKTNHQSLAPSLKMMILPILGLAPALAIVVISTILLYCQYVLVPSRMELQASHIDLTNVEFVIHLYYFFSGCASLVLMAKNFIQQQLLSFLWSAAALLVTVTACFIVDPVHAFTAVQYLTGVA